MIEKKCLEKEQKYLHSINRNWIFCNTLERIMSLNICIIMRSAMGKLKSTVHNGH